MKINIGSIPLLGIVFVTLKLCKIIAWPWFWVLCPFWAFLLLIILILIFFAFVVFVIEIME